MFVTEFGTQKYTGDGGNDFARAQQYLDLMASKRISWTNWNWSDDKRSGAVFKKGTCKAGTYADRRSSSRPAPGSATGFVAAGSPVPHRRLTPA